jgi:TPR repeat protein
MVGSDPQSWALAEGFYWMAEKLAWGYEDVEQNLGEAFKLFKQAADLGFSDALIRVGEFQEHGKGTTRNPNAAIWEKSEIASGNRPIFSKILPRSMNRPSSPGLIWSTYLRCMSATIYLARLRPCA